jgi:hypothetical protein
METCEPPTFSSPGTEQLNLVKDPALQQGNCLYLVASFGPRVSPQKLTESNRHKDRWDLGSLASHIISRSPDEPDNVVLQQRMISLASIGKSVDVKFNPSPELVDFLPLCFLSQGGLDRILKVGDRRLATEAARAEAYDSTHSSESLPLLHCALSLRTQSGLPLAHVLQGRMLLVKRSRKCEGLGQLR